jgi:hypothetical protein
MTKSDNEKILVQDGDTVIELTGEKKEAFLADRKLWAEQELERKTQAEAKATAKAALLTKLGITAEEARLLLS